MDYTISDKEKNWALDDEQICREYQETVQYLYNSTPVFEHVGAAAYKEGLYNSLALDEHLGHPHEQYKTIHVAGTNGKGSCSHTLASILQHQGYKVGLYTSPHLVDFRERIRVNGVCISKQRVIDFVKKEKHFFEPLHPSFFELTTALAFLYFAEQKVDVAIIEVGLGGRLDCTNIITPVLSVITNISLDHTEFLGSTLSKIASEKAGIIKKGVPVVIGEYTEETHLIFEKKATAMDAPIFFAEDNQEIIRSFITNYPPQRIYETRHFGKFNGDLLGDYQVKNANTVLASIKQLTLSGILPAGNLVPIQAGFQDVCKTTGLLGRWQTLSHRPTVVCDTGHNVGGWNYLTDQLTRQNYQTLRIVFGMVDDKDVETVMSILPPKAIYYFTQATTHRAIPKEKILSLGKKHHLIGDMTDTVSQAFMKAIKDANADDFIFVGGSSYIVADLLEFLQNRSFNCF